MKETIRYGFILGLICLIASSLLAGVNFFTSAKIIAQSLEEEEASLKEVMPECTHFEPVKAAENILYYKAFDKNKTLTGVAFKAYGKGYSSSIETMVGMRKDGTIISIKILSQNETPGLGSQVTGPAFRAQFRDKNIPDLDKVQAITGATISSRAVIDSVRAKAQEIKSLIKDGR